MVIQNKRETFTFHGKVKIVGLGTAKTRDHTKNFVKKKHAVFFIINDAVPIVNI